jgi:hypothetical protein
MGKRQKENISIHRCICISEQLCVCVCLLVYVCALVIFSLPSCCMDSFVIYLCVFVSFLSSGHIVGIVCMCIYACR